MRGKKPSATIAEEAQRCAEKMGYHWVPNTVAALPFDAFMFLKETIVAVRLKKVRYAVDDNVIIEKKFPEDVDGLRSLPLPPHVVRELWLRTQNERAWRRFYVLPDTTAEIEENTFEGYRNKHYREAYWKKAPYQIEFSRTDLMGDEEK
ncbi:MAG: hypothetical protein A4E35_02326 [Methanoregula sp. PtaU1.Bin051]|nr:MAG: hypothetical protein A4E35_02326 [Methanoregula sp. PtaU1.Bin051]